MLPLKKVFLSVLVILLLTVLWSSVTVASMNDVKLSGTSQSRLTSVTTWARFVSTGLTYSSSIRTDGGYAVAGTTSGHVLVLTLNELGNIIWSKTYNGNQVDGVSSIARTLEGGYIVAGQSGSFGSGAFVLKLDGLGNVIWLKTYGVSNSDSVTSIASTTDGSYVLAGSSGSSGNDFWVFKIDSDGNVLWSNTYDGENYADVPNSIASTSDGGYIVAGGIGTGSFGGDAWILRLDGSGNIVWQKRYGGAGYDEANSILQTNDGGFIVAGNTWSFGANGAWVFKLDSSGNIIWQKTYGHDAYDAVYSVLQTNDGGYVLAGKLYTYGSVSDYWVFKTNASGDMIWQKTYGWYDGEEAHSIIQSSDGGYVVVGISNSFAAFYSILAVKIDASGQLGGTCSMTQIPTTNTTNSSSTPVSSSATPTIRTPTIVANSPRITDMGSGTDLACAVSTIDYYYFPLIGK